MPKVIHSIMLLWIAMSVAGFQVPSSTIPCAGFALMSSSPSLRFLSLGPSARSPPSRLCPQRILVAGGMPQPSAAAHMSATMTAMVAMSTLERAGAELACTQMKVQLSSPDFEKKKVPGDGSCLFHSVAVVVGGGTTGQGLRDLAASEVSRLASTEFNGATIQQWIEWETGLSASEYSARMSKGGSWGGQVELAVLAGALGRTIEVFRQEAPRAYTREHAFGKGGGDAVRLVYDGSHYEALVRTSVTASASADEGQDSAAGQLAMFVEAGGKRDRKWGMVVEGVPAPNAGEHTATVIWAHGLGDTGFGWSPVTQSFGMPWVKFLFPTAPVEPVQLNMGMAMNSWFDIFGLTGDDDEDTNGILSSAAYLKRLVQKEISAGIPADRIVLAGFSQGGAIALTAAMAMETPIAGIIAASTWLPRITAATAGVGTCKSPLLQCHGTDDPVVLFDWGKQSFEKARELGMAGDFKSYPGMQHSFCPEEMADVTEFLRRTLPKK